MSIQFYIYGMRRETWWNPGKWTIDIASASAQAPNHMSSGVSGLGHGQLLLRAINWTAVLLRTMLPPPAKKMPSIAKSRKVKGDWRMDWSLYLWCNRSRNCGRWHSRTSDLSEVARTNRGKSRTPAAFEPYKTIKSFWSVSMGNNNNRVTRHAYTIPEDGIVVSYDVPSGSWWICGRGRVYPTGQVVDYGHRLGAVAALCVGHAQRHRRDSLVCVCVCD